MPGPRKTRTCGPSLEVQVRLEPVQAPLAAEARLAVAAEGRGRVEAVVRVRPDDAGAQPLRHGEDAGALLRPDAGREAVGRVVRLLDGLVGRAEGQHGQDGPEDLLLGDAVALGHVREDGGREPPALLRQAAGRLVDLGALLLPARDELLDLLELLGRVDRADVGVLVERVADAERAHAPLELADDGLVDRLLHEEARPGAAHVPLVEVDAVDDPLDRLVERRVVEDDVRGLAAELEGELLARSGDGPLDLLAHLGRAGEGDLVHVGVLDDLGAGAPVAGDDVDDARGQPGLAEDVAEEERAERRRLGRLEDDSVAGRERGRDLPREHEEGEVPGDDLAGDPDRPRAAVGEGVLELVRPAGVVEEVGRRERDIDVARLADGLAAVERLEHGELARAFLEDARDAEQVLRPLARSESGPAVLEGVARGLHGEVDVLRAGVRDLGERLLRRRVHARLELVRARLDELAADEEPVALLEAYELARLGRARVLEGGGDRRAVPALGDVGHGCLARSTTETSMVQRRERASLQGNDRREASRAVSRGALACRARLDENGAFGRGGLVQCVRSGSSFSSCSPRWPSRRPHRRSRTATSRRRSSSSTASTRSAPARRRTAMRRGTT